MGMNWEDERYVRLYTRDTVDWLSLSFEAQGLLACILRKLSRAGVIELGKHGKRGVAVAIGHPHRWETIAPALEELLADGVIVLRKNCLLAPNFQQAQEANQSDAARQRARRERIRDELLASELLGEEFKPGGDESPPPPPPPSGPVTKRDAPSRDESNQSQGVTKRDELSRGGAPASRAVTPSQPSVPSQPNQLIQPSQPEKNSSSISKEEDEEEKPATRKGDSHPEPADLQAVWNAHKAKEMPQWTETPKARKKAARARLEERPDLGAWETIVKRLAESKFARGLVPGSSGSYWIADPDFLLRPDSAAKILEGKYDERGPKPAQPVPIAEQPDTPAGRTWGGLLTTWEETGKSYAISWLRRIRAIDMDEATIHLECPDRYFIDWVSDHYLPMIADALFPRQVRFYTANELAAATG